MNTILYRGSISFDRRPINFMDESLKSIREWFDGEIIVSTWKGQEHLITDKNLINKLIVDDDPGSGPMQSFKRQAKSFLNGIDACNGDIIAVLRPDMIFTKDMFQALPEPKTKNNGQYQILNNRITVGNMMTIHPEAYEANKNFRISDWVHIGKKEDLKKWCDIIDIIESEDYDGIGGTEQAWAFSVIKKHLYPNLTVKEIGELHDHYWNFLLNNFTVLNTISTLGLINKNWDFQPEFHPLYLTEETYNKKYNELYEDNIA